MSYREIIAVCSEIHAKHINTAVWAESEATIFCHELSNQPIILFPLTAEPFSATSRCTVSCSSTDCRNPTLPRDNKQCAFWNIAICWTEVHSKFCAVTAQHTAQSVSAVRPSLCSLPTAPVYLAITGLHVLASCLPSVKRSPHRLLDTCLSTNA